MTDSLILKMKYIFISVASIIIPSVCMHFVGTPYVSYSFCESCVGTKSASVKETESQAALSVTHLQPVHYLLRDIRPNQFDPES